MLTNKAGWIYSYFLDGLLPYQNTITSATREKFNNSIQLAIWMEVANANPNTTVPWTAAALANIYIQGGYDQTWVNSFLGISYSGDHGVQMMNIRASSAANAGHIQDQLVRNTPPPNGTPPNGTIPEPSALLVWSLLAGSVGLWRFSQATIRVASAFRHERSQIERLTAQSCASLRHRLELRVLGFDDFGSLNYSQCAERKLG